MSRCSNGVHFKSFMSSLVPIVLLMIWLPQPLVAQGPSLVAHERVSLSSKALGGDQLLYIHLPEGYAETNQEYPVIFVLDPEERFAHTCAAVEHLSAPYIAAIPKAILVGVKSTDRYRDLTTPAGKNWSVPDFIKNHGKADTFIRYLHDEVVPFVESKYRASPFRIVVGHSLGGLFWLHVMVAKPDRFARTSFLIQVRFGTTARSLIRLPQNLENLVGTHCDCLWRMVLFLKECKFNWSQTKNGC